MAFRLSELLERMRPAGAPGGAADGEQSPEQLAATEVAELAELLRDSEADADREMSRPAQRAQQIRQEAEQRARRTATTCRTESLRPAWPGRRSSPRQHDAELSRIADQTARELDRLDAQAGPSCQRLVDATIARSGGHSRSSRSRRAVRHDHGLGPHHHEGQITARCAAHRSTTARWSVSAASGRTHGTTAHDDLRRPN